MGTEPSLGEQPQELEDLGLLESSDSKLNLQNS